MAIELTKSGKALNRSERSILQRIAYRNSEEYKNKHNEYLKSDPRGYLLSKWCGMKNRVRGGRTHDHVYKNLPICTRQEFFNWALNDQTYIKLLKLYNDSGRPRKLAPSIDRIVASKGYVLSNMRWLTQSENVKLGNINRTRRKKRLPEIRELANG